MTERGSEMSDLASSAPSAPVISSPDVGDPTAVIDDELLIAEVKKHPTLYDNAYAEYIEKEARIKNWNKVCQSLFKQWNELSPKKKREKIKIVQNKWQKQTDNFFKSYKGVPKHPTSKRSKKYIDSMTFLVPSTVASDVDVDACASNTNSGADHAHISDVTPMDITLPPETPQVNIPNKPPPVPSTSEQVGEAARTSEVQKQPYFIPMPEIGLPQPMDPNPNVHFALMLVPLLNRLSQKELYSAWPQILNIIKDAEGERFSVLQQELVYPPAVETQGKVVETVQEEVVEEEAIYPSRYGRPTNAEGEIMYPETDHEDLDEV